MLRSLWLVCVLTVASATAWAQPAPQPRPAAASVETARQAATTAEQKVGTLVAQRAQLTQRYQQQLAAIDGLKKQKASWRRDRELQSAQASANDTATRLTALDKQLAAARTAVSRARMSVIVAIDTELATGATGTRARDLGRLRAQLMPAAPAPKKIVIPDAEIDPLADPEELERQAAALAAVEKQLDAQRKGLDRQHADLKLVAELRSAHDRAIEQSIRDDDQPHRGAQRSNSRTSAEDAAPSSQNDGAGSPGGAGGGGTNDSGGLGESFGGDKPNGTSFESTAAVALGEVIDRSTIDGMLRASRSGDPKQRAQAAAQARDAVAKRLEQLQKKRAMIMARAKQLRERNR